MGVIYLLTFPNGKQYVGQTGNIKIRFDIYKRDKKTNTPVYHAIRKYGWDSIQKTMMNCSEQYMDWQEREAIKLYETRVPNGYNLEGGGNKNKHVSEETREKISKALKGKKGLWKHTEEAKKKMSEDRKGRKAPESFKRWLRERKGEKHPGFGKKWSEEVRKRMSEGHGKGEQNSNFGKHRSEETRKRMSKSHKGLHAGEKHPGFGFHRSEKTKEKISKANKGEKNGMYGRKGEESPSFGIHVSKETKEKLSRAAKGRVAWNKGQKGLQIAWNKGIPRTEEQKKNHSEAIRKLWAEGAYSNRQLPKDTK